MHISDLSEEDKIYSIELSNKKSFRVRSQDKNNILKAQGNFIELKTGEIINKSFIISITVDLEATCFKFNLVKNLKMDKNLDAKNLIDISKFPEDCSYAIDGHEEQYLIKNTKLKGGNYD